ncbi:hypothetical protein FA13DRAFT_1804256 [Coprinellus micaceus]|uniref:Uncharacterized protein n=1 Tax=Coprinellus micaceus TaxID=71717 RepID=A0A4Y7S884_COPMI|nr:hypothetical protein FA13DRAFT_1804256 [Coprinellus micaceus]
MVQTQLRDEDLAHPHRQRTYSAGDAMRDIYTRGLVTSEDFILVHGDLVSNVRIDEVDPEATPPSSSSTATPPSALHYEPAFAYPKKKLAHIPREVLNEHKQVEVRYDLLIVGSMFVRRVWLSSFQVILEEEVLTSDLLMKNIHIYVEKDGYAARVQDTKSYDLSARTSSPLDVPLVPDDNYPGGERYLYTTGSQYLPKSPSSSGTISRSAQISRQPSSAPPPPSATTRASPPPLSGELCHRERGDSNAIVWLDKPPEDDDLESPENFLNRRYMRLGASLYFKLALFTYINYDPFM